MVLFSSSLKIRGVVRDEGEEEIFAAIYCQMCCARNNRKPTKCQKDLDFYVSLHVSFVSQTMPANFETCDPKDSKMMNRQRSWRNTNQTGRQLVTQ